MTSRDLLHAWSQARRELELASQHGSPESIAYSMSRVRRAEDQLHENARLLMSQSLRASRDQGYQLELF